MCHSRHIVVLTACMLTPSVPLSHCTAAYDQPAVLDLSASNALSNPRRPSRAQTPRYVFNLAMKARDHRYLTWSFSAMMVYP